MEKILVSACLIGKNCRYDGKNSLKEEILQLQDQFMLIPICPEVDGGMSTPRLPSERRGNQVINQIGEDNTLYFHDGAIHALALVKEHHIRSAILKSKSPSCGKDQIYDGTFSSTLTTGDGVLVEYLKKEGITIYNEHDFMKILKRDSE